MNRSIGADGPSHLPTVGPSRGVTLRRRIGIVGALSRLGLDPRFALSAAI